MEIFVVTKLDAAAHYSSDHLDDPDNWRLVEKAKGMSSLQYFMYIVVDPDQIWIRTAIQELCGSGSVFRIRIRIHTGENSIYNSCCFKRI